MRMVTASTDNAEHQQRPRVSLEKPLRICPSTMSIKPLMSGNYQGIRNTTGGEAPPPPYRSSTMQTIHTLSLEATNRAANERNMGGSPIDSQPAFEQDTSQRGSKTIKRAARSPQNNAQNRQIVPAPSAASPARRFSEADYQHPVPFLFRQTRCSSSALPAQLAQLCCSV